MFLKNAKHLTSSLLIGAVLFSTGACTKSQQKSHDTQTLDVASIRGSATLTSAEKAEKLALISEQLFSLTNFMHAVDLADMALGLDPNNARAQFYKKAAGPLMALRGLAVRVKPLMDEEQLIRWNAQIDNFPDSALKSFLLDGQEDMGSEKGIHQFVDSYIEAMNDMRVLAKSYSGPTLTLNANDWSWAGFISRKTQECLAMTNPQGEYTGFECPLKQAGQIKLNAADMKGIQQMYAAFQFYFTIINAYDMTGMMALSKASEEKPMSSKEAWAFLGQFKDFGTYRASSQLQLVKEMGLDAVSAYRWAMSIQKQLCPEGVESLKNRPGYLFNTGLCVEKKSDSEETLALVEAILNGGLMPATYESANGNFEYKTEVRPMSFFTNPIRDLKTLKPQFKTCVEKTEGTTGSVSYRTESVREVVIQVSDATMGGLFPNADFNYILRIQDPCAAQ